MKQKTENGKPITSQLFGVPISIINKPQALALIGEWLREYRSVISSRLSVIGSLPAGRQGKSAGFQSAGSKPINRKPTNLKQKTENRKLITGYPKIIVTPNPEIIVAAQSDPALMEALQEADLSIPDGIGVVWALKLLWKGKSGLGREAGMDSEGEGESEIFSLYPYLLPFRLPNPNLLSIRALSGLDLMESLISELPRTLPQGLSSKESPWKVMLLGGRPGVAQAAAKILSENSENSDSRKIRQSESRKSRTQPSGSLNFRFSDSSGSPSIPSVLKIKAISSPKDIVHASKSELNELINSINSFQPDLLFVAFGHPKQEKWLIANRESLTVGVAMAVGGAFDQIADPSLRPPPYINSIWLGWLYRLLRQPWRWKRQLALITFIFMVVRSLPKITKIHEKHERTFLKGS